MVRDIGGGNWRLGAKFFWKEFTLNYVMATYSKPQVIDVQVWIIYLVTRVARVVLD